MDDVHIGNRRQAESDESKGTGALGCGAVRACKNPSYFKAQEVTKHTEDVPHSLAVNKLQLPSKCRKMVQSCKS